MPGCLQETKCPQASEWSTPSPPPRFSIISCCRNRYYFSKKPGMVEYASRRRAEGWTHRKLRLSKPPSEDWKAPAAPYYIPRMIHQESLLGCFALKLVKFIRKDFTHSKWGRSRNTTVWAKKRNIFLACGPIRAPTCTYFSQVTTQFLKRERKI